MWELQLFGRQFKIHWEINGKYKVVAADDPTFEIYPEGDRCFGEIYKGLGLTGCAEILERGFYRYISKLPVFKAYSDYCAIGLLEDYTKLVNNYHEFSDIEIIEQFCDYSNRCNTSLPMPVDKMGELMRKRNELHDELIARGYESK